jgi:hypothetical protein
MALKHCLFKDYLIKHTIEAFTRATILLDEERLPANIVLTDK